MGAWRLILLFIIIVLIFACTSSIPMPIVTKEKIVSSPTELNISPLNPKTTLVLTPTGSLVTPTFPPSLTTRAESSRGKFLYQNFGIFILPIDCELQDSSCKPAPQLITNPSDLFAHLSWSPTADEILFSSDTGNAFGIMSVYIIDDRGETIIRVTPVDVYADFPEWSPDGQKIAFETGYGGYARVINRDGTNLENISSLPSRNPKWSPEGDKLGLLVDRSSNQRDLYIVSLPSTQELLIAENVGGDFAWSNNGLAIVYFSISERTLCIRQIEDPRSIKPDQESDCLSLETRGAYGFKWSQTNDLLLFLAGDPFSPEIYSLHVDCEKHDDSCDLQLQRITNSGKDKRSPIWLGDSGLIAYFEEFSDGWSLLLVTDDGDRYAVLETHMEAPSDLEWNGN